MVEAVQQIKYKPQLTVEELKILPKFIDLLKTKNVIYDQEINEDNVLIRFLRARKLDLNKTFEMFTKYLKWRLENNIEEISKYEFSELPKVKVFYPHGFHKVDKMGRPLYFEITGDLNVDELFKITNSERLLKYEMKQYEYLLNHMFPICSQNAKSYITQSVTILDIKKHTTKFLSKKILDFLKMISGFAQDYYPETLGALYVINAGFTFKVIWTAIKAFLDEKTRKKVTTLGSDYKKKLLEIIDEENLPSIIGGKCHCEPYGCIYSNAGPWKSENSDNVEINNEIIELNKNYMVDNLCTQGDIETGDENPNKLVDDEDFDEENNEKLKELSNQLKMNLVMNGGKETTNSMQFMDGETPINTQEVKYN